MKDEIAQHKRLQLVDDRSQADLVLSGELLYIPQLATATNAVNEPIEYTQTFTADAQLTGEHTRQAIWSATGSFATNNYAIVSTAVITTSPEFLQQNLRSQDAANLPNIQLAAAPSRLSQQQNRQNLAQSVYVSMSEGF